jgi:REP element-mobilizing transposase RayT
MTFRLGDSLPSGVAEILIDELRHAEPTRRNLEKRRRLEGYLDAGHGACLLRSPQLGGLVENALLRFHGERYLLLAWCVMPNHVHVLAMMRDGFALGTLVHAWKSWTATHINRACGRSGPLWSRDYFDRYIRNERHFRNVVQYIERNPVAAGLAVDPREWPLGSARFGSPTILRADDDTIAGIEPPAFPTPS